MNTTKTPAEILAHEVVLGELADKAAETDRRLDSAIDSVHYAARDRRSYNRGQRWEMRFTEAKAKCEELAARPASDDILAQRAEVAAGNDTYGYTLQALKRNDAPFQALVEYNDCRAANLAAVTVIHEHEKNYDGWSRFYLVPWGHIHKSTHCPSLRPTTSICWLPEMSGQTEAEAVEAHGPTLCSKCYRSAPVEWQQKMKVAKSNTTTLTVSSFGGAA